MKFALSLFSGPAIVKYGMSNRLLVIIIFVGIVAGLAVTIGVLFVEKKKSGPASIAQKEQVTATPITGTLGINGVIPQGATITLTAKTANSSAQEQVFAAGLPASDGEAWGFDSAVAGTAYEIQASMMQNGKIITESSPITVSAPADQETVVLNIESQSAKPTADAIISGNVIVNGYIPDGSTITVQGRQLGKNTFTTIAEGLPGQARQFLSYTTALSGVTYEVQANLIAADGTTNLGTSNTILVTAPAVNESVTINSTAPAPVTATPTPTVTPTPIVVTATSQPATPTITPTPSPVPTPTPITISGSINFNGVTPPNSRIVVLQKVYNTQNYQVAVDNIPVIDGATWTWTGAQQATWYDLIAVLKQSQSNGTDQDLSTSAMMSVAAPASNVSFTLNSSFSLSAPSGPITVTCGNLSGSNWNAQISFGPVSGAQAYWFQVGITNGGTELMNTAQNTSNNNGNQTIGASLQNGTTYYARYAYANVANANAGNSQYSPFTATTPLQCN